MNPLHHIVSGGLAALVCFSGPVSAGLLTDADPDWKEGEYQLPAAPKEASLRPFFVSSASPNRFLIDEDSISVGKDGVFRYVLVVTTPGGARNVTFEGIRCETGERRLYATGRSDGSWAAARDDSWRPIVDNNYNRPRAALAKDYFCGPPVPPSNRKEVLTLLRRTPLGHEYE